MLVMTFVIVVVMQTLLGRDVMRGRQAGGAA
jgi:hypothetical protein